MARYSSPYCDTVTSPSKAEILSAQDFLKEQGYLRRDIEELNLKALLGLAVIIRAKLNKRRSKSDQLSTMIETRVQAEDDRREVVEKKAESIVGPGYRLFVRHKHSRLPNTFTAPTAETMNPWLPQSEEAMARRKLEREASAEKRRTERLRQAIRAKNPPQPRLPLTKMEKKLTIRELIELQKKQRQEEQS